MHMWKNVKRQYGREKGNTGKYIGRQSNKEQKRRYKMFYEKNKDKILMNILNMKLKSKQEKEWNEGGKKHVRNDLVEITNKMQPCIRIYVVTGRSQVWVHSDLTTAGHHMHI